MRETPWGMWDPLSPGELVEELRALDAHWWLAGGFALEAWVGRPWREHDDIDAAISRPDQLRLRSLLEGWDPHAADPPGQLRPWAPGEELPPAVHDIWVRRDAGGPWKFQFMLDETEDGNWVYRRDGRIRLPQRDLWWERKGVRYIRPEVQLLYKSRSRRPKDEVDFTVVMPLLGHDELGWLEAALALSDPSNPWLTRVRAQMARI